MLLWVRRVGVDLIELQVVRKPRTKMYGSSDQGDFQSDLLGELVTFVCLQYHSLSLRYMVRDQSGRARVLLVVASWVIL